MKIFISHSSEDVRLVKSFTNLLETGLHIDSKEIYCTTIYKNIDIGDDFINNIRENLHNAETVFCLISENYVNNYICLMEMGASWVLKDNIFPITVPPLTHNFLKDTPFSHLLAGVFNNKSDIYNIYERLVKKGIINRLDFEKERELKETIEKFIEQTNKYIYGFYKEALEMANRLIVAENGDPDALKIDRKNEIGKDIISLNCDFRPNDFYLKPSSFLSYVLQFYPYTNFVYQENKSLLCFEIRSENGSISDVIVEIKCSDKLVKVFEKRCAISNKWEKYVIPLSPDIVRAELLKEVSEICFVIRPNFAKEHFGTLDISNLRLVGALHQRKAHG